MKSECHIERNETVGLDRDVCAPLRSPVIGHPYTRSVAYTCKYYQFAIQNLLVLIQLHLNIASINSRSPLKCVGMSDISDSKLYKALMVSYIQLWLILKLYVQVRLLIIFLTHVLNLGISDFSKVYIKALEFILKI